MTAVPRDLEPRRPAEVVPAQPTDPQVNPHTAPAVIMAVTVIAAAVASVHTANAQPDHLGVAVYADLAAIGGFLHNLARHRSYQDKQR